MTEQMLWAWARFSYTATGDFLPINFMEDEPGEQEEEGEVMAIGFACGDGIDPITCRNGSIVRRLVLTFPFDREEIVWH